MGFEPNSFDELSIFGQAKKPICFIIKEENTNPESQLLTLAQARFNQACGFFKH